MLWFYKIMEVAFKKQRDQHINIQNFIKSDELRSDERGVWLSAHASALFILPY